MPPLTADVLATNGPAPGIMDAGHNKIMFNCVINFGGQRCEWHHEKGFGWHHIISVLAVSINSKSYIFQRKGMACVKLLVKSNANMLV